MSVKRAILAALAVATLAAPLTAAADPYDNGGVRAHHDAGGDGRGHDWRARHDGERGFARHDHYARCSWVSRGYADRWGAYRYHQVRVCR